MQGCSLKQVFSKIPRKLQGTNAPESLFNNAAGPQQIFTGNCFSSLLGLSVVFGQVKNLVKMYKFSLKTKYKSKSKSLENSNNF